MPKSHRRALFANISLASLHKALKKKSTDNEKFQISEIDPATLSRNITRFKPGCTTQHFAKFVQQMSLGDYDTQLDVFKQVQHDNMQYRGWIDFFTVSYSICKSCVNVLILFRCVNFNYNKCWKASLFSID